MATNKPRIYIDACYYIDVARGRAALPIDPDRAAEVPIVENLLLAGMAKDIEIMASALLISECLFADKEHKHDIPEIVKQTFVSILTSGQVVRLVAADFFVAERARDLLWAHDISCGGPADCIHVATALEMKCQEFITSNRRKGPLQGDAPTKLFGLGGLRVVRASQTAVLPEKYTRPILTLHEQGGVISDE